MKKKTAKLGFKVLSYPVIETYHISPDTHVILRNKKYEVRHASLNDYMGVSFHDRKAEEWICEIKTISQFKIIEELFFGGINL